MRSLDTSWIGAAVALTVVLVGHSMPLASEPGEALGADDGFVLRKSVTCTEPVQFPCKDVGGERRIACTLESPGETSKTLQWRESQEDRTCSGVPVGLATFRLVADDGRPVFKIRERCGRSGTIDRVRPLHRVALGGSGGYALPFVSECERVEGVGECGYAAQYWEAWLTGDVVRARAPSCPAQGEWETAYGCLVPPNGRHMPAPDYPGLALRGGVKSGAVVLGALINASGSVEAAEVLDVDPPGLGFEEAARQALLGWAYSPALLEGRAVPVYWIVQIDFGVEARARESR